MSCNTARDRLAHFEGPSAAPAEEESVSVLSGGRRSSRYARLLTPLDDDLHSNQREDQTEERRL